uniref:Uncharacterized protein n=1 Tax=Spongospora subterranea TaxID=70186 RepID=A0A0H5REQ3_9EUKA|eukprot:CRZ12513.1 hypothetical protein [Spongospora subterranea]
MEKLSAVIVSNGAINASYRTRTSLCFYSKTMRNRGWLKLQRIEHYDGKGKPELTDCPNAHQHSNTFDILHNGEIKRKFSSNSSNSETWHHQTRNKRDRLKMNRSLMILVYRTRSYSDRRVQTPFLSLNQGSTCNPQTSSNDACISSLLYGSVGNSGLFRV